MAHCTHLRTDAQKEFYKILNSLCGSKSVWEVWHDTITMFAIAIANLFNQDGELHDEREKEYLQIIARYKKPEQSQFPKLFSLLVDTLKQDPEQDFLGNLYMLLNLNSKSKKQIFTPYDICRIMSKIQLSDAGSQIAEKGWISIYDPACGSGSTLIAARNLMVEQKFDYKNILFVAQDIDRIPALMCYIQLSLLGCAGYVVVANTITNPIVGTGGSPLLISPMPDQEFWVTPLLYSDPWVTRIENHRLL